VQRRDFILSAFAALTWPTAAGASSTMPGLRPIRQRLAKIERRVAGRLGVAALDVGAERRLAHRANERFPLCSTFKWLLTAQILARVDRGAERLGRQIPYGPSDLLEYAPVTREHVSEGAMSISALCAAAIQYSDNTAANLLLGTVGGPSGLTACVRGIGDPVTRLDRIESGLNSAVPGDPRDTTTPAAMAANPRRVLRGRALTEPSRERLLDWLVGNTTGDAKLRAGLPTHWRVGDKTGMGANGATNDVAIVWPARKAPILVAAYLTESTAPASERNNALADVGRLIAEWVNR
jgi:beta-lactamase class A